MAQELENPADNPEWVAQRTRLIKVPRNTNWEIRENRKYRWVFPSDVDDRNNLDARGYQPFTCKLQSGRCVYEMRNGRCSRRTVIPFGLCWQHALYKNNLRVGQTTLTDNAGERLNFLGLFACDMRQYPVPENRQERTIVFRQGQLVCTMVGERFNERNYTRRYDDILDVFGDDTLLPYVEKEMDTNLVIDAACVRGIGSLSNMCNNNFNANCVNGQLQNNTVTIDGDLLRLRPGHRNRVRTYPVLEATQNILNGDEILNNYGAAYFDGAELAHETRPQPQTNYSCPRRR